MQTGEEKITVTRTLPNGKEQTRKMTKTQYALLGSNPGWQQAKARKPKEAEGNPEEPAPGEEFPAGKVPETPTAMVKNSAKSNKE